jgi:hypothetical protein
MDLILIVKILCIWLLLSIAEGKRSRSGSCTRELADGSPGAIHHWSSNAASESGDRRAGDDPLGNSTRDIPDNSIEKSGAYRIEYLDIQFRIIERRGAIARTAAMGFNQNKEIMARHRT